MPRDEWAKARARDAARKGRNRNVTRSGNARGRKTTAKMRAIHDDRLQSWGCLLWFGKHKGKRLRECPDSYLHFLTTIEPTSPRIKLVSEFVKKELQNTR